MKEPKLIINTITDWNEPPRARHQFTYAISKKIPVVFVARNKTGPKKITISQIEENILLIEPYFPIDYRFRYRFPILNEIYQHWLYAELRTRYPAIPVINFDFTATRLASYFKDTIYYCNDEYTGNSKYWSGWIDWYISSCEKRVIRNSIFCITTSNYLTNKLKNINKLTFEIPLGVSIEGIPAIQINKQINDKIVVGLMGVISSRQISIPLINTILQHDKFRLVLIGPVEKSFSKKIQKSENVLFTGILKGVELANELNKLDICIATYNLKKVNPGTTPNKLWQYLMLGKPIVVSDLPNLREFNFPEKSVYILKEEKEIIGLLLKVFEENSEDLIKQRCDFAKLNTWEHRIEKFIGIYKTYLPAQAMKW